MSDSATYLDFLSPLQARVGYGELGLHGNLGYEGKPVVVQGSHYRHALSTHPPARLRFHLGGRFSTFECLVALNDDVPAGASHADFTVVADGRQVAGEVHVKAGQPARALTATIAGAQLLELMVSTSRWEYCHAVWLEPRVDGIRSEISHRSLADCLGRTKISLPSVPPRSGNCIATVVSPGFEFLLDDMLGSLYANGDCQDALLVIFVINGNSACARLVAKYRGTLIRCRSLSSINATSKGVLYTAARVVDAQKFICLDADMLVLGNLRPLFATLDACPQGAIMACREGNHSGLNSLSSALRQVYGGTDLDRKRWLSSEEDATYPLVANDGLFAGGRSALLALDAAIRGLPGASAWVDQRRDIWWRNQFIFNLALSRLKCGLELDGVYNVQLHAQDVQIRRTGGRIQAEWRGQRVRVLHLSGQGRQKYPEWRGVYAHVRDPLVGRGGGDGYAAFLAALRTWIGLHGVASLAWSFYGTTDARSARVPDPDVFPLLGLVHYLLRSNGATRILETGTARGVSAACLASAVAHRPNARVVTLDPCRSEEREDLWGALPKPMRECIEARQVGSLEGMAAAIEAGEQYEAALLDSIHTAEHVWAEFDLARRLVCASGLILIHDARYAGGTVEQALQRIEAAGYGVTRLWTAERGATEDDRLGLALVENRRRNGQGS
jgi:predicted O-methyltransferase YrrM